MMARKRLIVWARIILTTKPGRYGFGQKAWNEPQGSLLGPTLFALFFNNLYPIPFFLNICLFADSITLYISGADLSVISQKISSDFHLHAPGWMHANCLSINASQVRNLAYPPRSKLFSNSQKIRSSSTTPTGPLFLIHPFVFWVLFLMKNSGVMPISPTLNGSWSEALQLPVVPSHPIWTNNVRSRSIVHFFLLIKHNTALRPLFRHTTVLNSAEDLGGMTQ